MKKRKISLLAIISILVFIASSIMLSLARSSTEIANALDSHVSAPFRRFMAGIGDAVPFSLFEILILLLPALAVLIIWRCVSVFKRGEGRARFILNVLAVALLLYSGNSIALGISYNTTGIDEYMKLSEAEVNEQTLREAAEELCLEINTLSEEISYSGGQSHSGYDMKELSLKICDSYALISEKYGYPDSFTSSAKSVDALHILSYLGLTGIYTYYTGEANVNTDYPDFDVTFTAAHELSHQRGVLRENEANFMAYLACSLSQDAYLRYSAALSMLSYVANALWQTNPDAYYEVIEGLNKDALSDLRASAEVTRKYGDTFISDISSFVNDMFLKSNGTDGVITYGRVVTLYMSYRETK